MNEPLCADRHCLIVGSAPGTSLPDPVYGELVMAANGGARIVAEHGREVDVLLTTAFLFRTDATRQEIHTQHLMAGVECEVVYVDEKCGSARWTASRLRSIGVTWQRIVGVPAATRNRITWWVNGALTLPWVSTGVWAACFALASGAASVEIAGISLGNGHAGMDWDQQPRYHVDEDRTCLRALASAGVVMPERLRRAVA